MAPRDYFEHLQAAMPALACGCDWTLTLRAETTDYVRFNRAAIRQPGTVTQWEVTLRLIRGRRHVSQTLGLSGHWQADQAHLGVVAKRLADTLPDLPEDPYLLVATTPTSTSRIEHSAPVAVDEVVHDILRLSTGTDLVGILANGPAAVGFASSYGVTHWHEVQAVAFDFSLQLGGDKAIKRMVAGPRWVSADWQAAFANAQSALGVLACPSRTLAPGRYRSYLAPAAFGQIVAMLNWTGVSAKAQRTRQSCLQRLVDGDVQLAASVHVADNAARGLAPAFDDAGFVRPAHLPLITAGQHAGAMVSARSAAEYGLTPTGSANEVADSLSVASGDLPQDQALEALGTGLYINNLWYLNHSDRARGRITGMTRFATFWVEDGQLVEPCTVMRFDDTLFRMLGDGLLALTRERSLLCEAGGYGLRDLSTLEVPGALIEGFQLTL